MLKQLESKSLYLDLEAILEKSHLLDSPLLLRLFSKTLLQLRTRISDFAKFP